MIRLPMRAPTLTLLTLLTACFVTACSDDDGQVTKRNPSKEASAGSGGKKAPADEPDESDDEPNEDEPSSGSAGKAGSDAAAGKAGSDESEADNGSAGTAGSAGAAGSAGSAGSGESGAGAGGAGGGGAGGAGGAAAGEGGAGGAGAGGEGGAAGSPPPVVEPKQYVFATAITSGDDSNTYVQTLDSLSGRFDTSEAREFGGFTDIAVIDRWLFTSNDESPVITRFKIEKDGSFKQDLAVSFANFGGSAPLYYNAFVSKTKAYVLVDSSEYVVWNPTTMEIEGTIPLPRIADRNGIEITPSLDRGMVVRGKLLYHAYAWTDYTDFITTPESIIVVIDTETDEVIKQIQAPCPDLDGGTLDEAGNLYFSNWTFAPAGTLLVDDGPKTCVVKIAADKQEIDPTFKLTFSDVTGGHEGAAFRYVGNGKALFSVFHEDHTPYDPMSDIESWVFGDNWRFMRIDLATQKAELIEDIGWSVGGYYPTRVGDDTYLLVQAGDDTNLYRVMPDNKANLALTTKGWATRLIALP